MVSVLPPKFARSCYQPTDEIPAGIETPAMAYGMQRQPPRADQMLRVIFHSNRQRDAFIRTSGIQSNEIVSVGCGVLYVTQSAIDWSINDWVMRVENV